MAPTENAEPRAEAAASLKGKTVLVVSSGSPKKRFIFQRLKALGLRVVLLTKENNWAARYADQLIEADTHDQAECIARVEEFVKDSPVDGAVTFWEDAI